MIISWGKLAEQLDLESSYASLISRAGVISDKFADPSIDIGHSSEVAGTVERVEASNHECGGVPDVVKPRGGREEIDFAIDDRPEGGGLGRYALSVCPAAG